METLRGIVFLMLPFAAVAGALAIIRWISGPLERAAKARHGPVQFTIADLFCLFFLIQLPLGTVRLLARDLDAVTVGTMDGYGLLVAGLLWWYGVQTLSRAEIRNPWHHVVLLVFVLPVSLFGCIAVPLLACAIFVAASDRQPEWTGVALGAEAAAVGLVYLCGRLTRRFVAAADRQD